MSNSFTDFFETLLPREITLYVIPGSLVLTTLFAALYIQQLDLSKEKLNLLAQLNELLDNYIKLRSSNSSIDFIDYIFFGIIWIGIAYFIGLIVGAIKQGIHPIIEDWEEINPLNKLKIKPKLKSRIIYQPPKENLATKENLAIHAMYLALCEEKMYRREIERYGVLVETIENTAIALIILGMVLPFISDVGWKIALLIIMIAIFPVLAGAQGYKRLQYYRIETMFKSLEKKEEEENKKQIIETMSNIEIKLLNE